MACVYGEIVLALKALPISRSLMAAWVVVMKPPNASLPSLVPNMWESDKVSNRGSRSRCLSEIEQDDVAVMRRAVRI